ncbi:lamin tail domain-containing protein [Streptomyces sp. NBC_00201]|uniref:lamin tail domain-containing protein n=1 Tax=unclassified Streptomyces TaxID=2593676 RepID=UPI002252AA23|nr:MULTISPECIES: lamin tail domain-containing protein [unclassified Streptomyces]MCX5251587.1 lamin tail domain-containing protein [Streptomyces sp. NBC_00201]MCX5294488.1 lamin tail domain-containing protein [Streptomyces sp. NBC_00183]
MPARAADHRPGRPHAAVFISGVQYDSPGRNDRSNGSLNKEWLELTNSTRRTVNLDGWTLSNKDGRTYTSHHYRLEGRSTVRVHTGVGHNNTTDVYQDRRTDVWDHHSDTATLRNDHGRFIDDTSWGRGHHGGHRH